MTPKRTLALVVPAWCLVMAGCGGAPAIRAGAPSAEPAAVESAPPSAPPTLGATATPEPTAEPTATPEPAAEPTATPEPQPSDHAVARPPWLGQRPLPLRDDGFGAMQPTPPELTDRRLEPPGPRLPDPPGGHFAAVVQEVPPDVAARSTWSPACPVGLEDLRYVTLSFWGFDDRAHTGELLVHASVADDLVEVFRALFEARFPIEEMRVVEPAELDAHPTGDGNNTTAFVCRPTRGSASWSQHAYGLAVDVNPFHNPYARGDVVLPELASAYLDRDQDRPGMVQPGDAVTSAFARIGWGWGGEWSGLADWMHFSANGR